MMGIRAWNPYARELFRDHYNGQTNIMTTTLLGYSMRAKGNLAIEFSMGEDDHGNKHYGVSVLNAHDPSDREVSKLSRSFSTEDEAVDYAKTLRSWRPS